MSDERKDHAENPEIESLNDKVLDADEANLDELEKVSGGAGGGTAEPDCVTFSCGTFSGSSSSS